MTERPILFSAPMVRALLDGTKTQTRRVLKPQPANDIAPADFPNPAAQGWKSSRRHSHGATTAHFCPYGQPGDRLWVRETWQAVRGDDRARHICTSPRPDVGWLEYAATPREDEPAYKWRPSIHMPRWASRIDLEVTGVRVERLQRINEADALAEGIERLDSPHPGVPLYRDYAPGHDSTVSPVHSYRTLWEAINGPGSWDANPWAWVVEFRRI